MRAPHRVTTIIVAFLLAFLGPATSARAEAQEAVKGADWIVTQKAASEKAGIGSVADDVLALVATGDAKFRSEIDSRVEYLRSNARKFVTESGSTAAAKLVIVAVATGQDPKAFGGIDLPADIKKDIKADGAIGAYPGPFASGLAMVALARAGEQVPTSMITYLLTYKQADDSFAYAKAGTPGDADNTSMAILGLRAAGSTDPALDKAIKWLEVTQIKDGEWAGYAPVNSTAMAGLLVPDEPSQKALAYLKSKQLASGALPTGAADAPGPNLIATQQAVVALAGKTYLDLNQDAGTPEPNPSPTPTESSGTTGGNIGSGLIPLALGAGAAAAIAAGVGLLLRQGKPRG